MYRIIIQEEAFEDETETRRAISYMKTIHDASSENKRIIAAMLRAIADEFDPKRSNND